MRVSMSAMGSLILISSTPYQLALTMPGISPRIAYSRSLPRARPNLLNTPRGRPVSWQRLRWRTGLALRGSSCNALYAAMRSSSLVATLAITALSSARLAAYFFTMRARFSSRLIKDNLAMPTSILERETEGGKQGSRFIISLGGGGDSDIHATQRIDLVVLDLGENDLFLDAHVVVAAAIKGFARNAPEVTDTRHRHRNQTIQEFVHLRTSQGHHAADRIVFTDLEAGNRLLRLG